MLRAKPGAGKHEEDTKSAVKRAVLVLVSDFSSQFVTIEEKNGNGGFAVGRKDNGADNTNLARRIAAENDIAVQEVTHSVVDALSSSKIHIGQGLSKSQLESIAAYLPQE